MTNQNIILCIALRRSGTTLLFRALRNTKQFTCYDEPFSRALIALPAEHPKRVWAELIQIYGRSPQEFRRRFAPIGPLDELRTNLETKQADYIRWLIEQSESVFCDLTRCHFKLESLQQIFPKATIVHLFRSPENFATSHLMPRRSSLRIRDRLRTLRDQVRFFQRRENFNSWHMQDILQSRHPLLVKRLEQNQIHSSTFDALPAYGKLMAYWCVVFREVQRTGARLFGSNFKSLPFGDFCDQPRKTINDLRTQLGMPCHDFDVKLIRKESQPFRPNSAKWSQMRELLHIDDVPER